MTSKRQSQPPSGKKTLIMVAATLLTTGFTASGHFNLQPFIKQSQPSQTQIELVTPETFARIKFGATLTDIRSALGAPGDEVSSSVGASTHRWGDLNSAYILCEFKEGVLVSKLRHNF